MRATLRGLLGFCLVIIFSVVAFSPGVSFAVEKSLVQTVLILDTRATEIHPVVAAVQSQAPKPAYEKTIGDLGSVAAVRVDGYMNWRMRDTTRNL